MAVAFSPPTVAQEDYHCMLLQENLLFYFLVIVSKIWNNFITCRILGVDLIQQTVQKESRF